MRLQYYVDEEGESVIGLWIPRRKCWIDVTGQDDQIWAALQPDGKKLRKEIETWISKGAPDGVAVDMDGLVTSSALHVQPCTIACLGKCYAAHAREFSGEELSEPSIFLKATSAISSDLSYVLNPPGASKLDYEVELAVILGDTLHNATAAEARRAIIGYTLMCDYSERSYQLEHGGQSGGFGAAYTFAAAGDFAGFHAPQRRE
jgi:2-keto-4-pentenoate hydratase/2-oxohepta-3-ene-1,7-dioic acid hydratase in catechol pathway